ncbi:solute carrier family 28 member 3-like protein [Dinothrombium tinctorium]|uniref:Sodium/nucleoside cotransporter n=1 Tax=Dinothrombium tinctorium TaxID=1965070 RepID=A0A443QLK9_9ACAR|nr:solute carrier family 28 member 3-like protein [Dinothrombium tinctorium]
MSVMKSRSESNVSSGTHGSNDTFKISSEHLSEQKPWNGKRLSCTSLPMDIADTQINDSRFSSASDVDGKINYMRRLSKNYGVPIDLYHHQSIPNSTSYVNEAYLETPTKDINFKLNIKGRHPLKIDIPEINVQFFDIKSAEENDEQQDCIEKTRIKLKRFLKKHSKYIKLLLFILYNIYLGFAIHRTWSQTKCYCDGVKFLVLLTAIVYFFMLYYLVLKKYVIAPCFRVIKEKLIKKLTKQPFVKTYLSPIIWFTILIMFVTFAIYISSKNLRRLTSAAGILGFIGIGYLLCPHRSRINWTPVFWGLTLQFLLAVFVMRSDFGKTFFKCLGDKVTTFLSFTDAGSSFVFGYLVTGEFQGKEIPIQGGIMAFKVFSVIIFFSFVTSILYYYGIMQVIVGKVGWFLQKTIGTTPCESLSASANIFLGMTEAPLLIKPYVSLMTKSELFAIMTGGFATIAGSVLAAYVSFGVNASHLLAASVMAAPSALGLSKLFYPETEESKTSHKALSIEQPNVLEAGANGACQAVKIIANITANLIAIIAFVYFINSAFSWFGSLLGAEYITFEWLLSKIFVPFAVLLGVDWQDVENVATLIGLKTVVNEFVAYKKLVEMKNAKILSQRAEIIATYALCGFSNFGSIGIQIGALGTLVPSRRPLLAQLGVKAMIAGSTVTLVSACFAAVSLFDHFDEPEQRWLRAGLFATFGMSGIIPAAHWAVAEGFLIAAHLDFLGCLLAMGISYLTGAIIYALRIPERFNAGKFDYWFSSHQLFHVFVVIGSVLHNKVVYLLVYYRLQLIEG